MSGLGIIDTDLCLWAGTVTREDLEVAPATLGHPTIKAKPGPVETVQASWWDEFVCDINLWVNAHPILAGAGIMAAWYLLTPSARRKR